MSHIFLITNYDTRVCAENTQLPQVKIVHVSHNHNQIQEIMLQYARNEVLEMIEQCRRLKDLQYFVNVTNLQGEQISRPDWGKTQDEIAAIYKNQIRQGYDVSVYHHNHSNNTPDVSRWIAKPNEISWVRENHMSGGIYSASRWEIHEIAEPRLYIPPTVLPNIIIPEQRNLARTVSTPIHHLTKSIADTPEQSNLARTVSTPVHHLTKSISETPVSSSSSSSYQVRPNMSPCGTSSISPSSQMSSLLSSYNTSPTSCHMSMVSSPLIPKWEIDMQKSLTGSKRHRKLYE